MFLFVIVLLVIILIVLKNSIIQKIVTYKIKQNIKKGYLAIVDEQNFAILEAGDKNDKNRCIIQVTDKLILFEYIFYYNFGSAIVYTVDKNIWTGDVIKIVQVLDMNNMFNDVNIFFNSKNNKYTKIFQTDKENDQQGVINHENMISKLINENIDENEELSIEIYNKNNKNNNKSNANVLLVLENTNDFKQLFKDAYNIIGKNGICILQTLIHNKNNNYKFSNISNVAQENNFILTKGNIIGQENIIKTITNDHENISFNEKCKLALAYNGTINIAIMVFQKIEL